MFKAKAALVTGSTSGIGLGMAETLAKKGCNIMLNGFGDTGEITRLQKRYFLKLNDPPGLLSLSSNWQI